VFLSLLISGLDCWSADGNYVRSVIAVRCQLRSQLHWLTRTTNKEGKIVLFVSTHIWTLIASVYKWWINIRNRRSLLLPSTIISLTLFWRLLC
jgi:hypothetical protein